MEEIQEHFTENFTNLQNKFKACEQGNFSVKYLNPALNGPGYNNVYKYPDIYGAILDCNIHVMKTIIYHTLSCSLKHTILVSCQCSILIIMKWHLIFICRNRALKKDIHIMSFLVLSILWITCSYIQFL